MERGIDTRDFAQLEAVERREQERKQEQFDTCYKIKPPDWGFVPEPTLRNITEPKRRMVVRAAPVHVVGIEVLDPRETQVQIRHPQQERDRGSGYVNRRLSGRAGCEGT